MVYCFDLDGTLCDTVGADYENSTPKASRISIVNQLYDDGNTIVIETARGSTTGINWLGLTKNQLDGWGVRYHKLRVGTKFYADFYVDDKALKDTEFFLEN